MLRRRDRRLAGTLWRRGRNVAPSSFIGRVTNCILQLSRRPLPPPKMVQPDDAEKNPAQHGKAPPSRYEWNARRGYPVEVDGQAEQQQSQCDLQHEKSVHSISPALLIKHRVLSLYEADISRPRSAAELMCDRREIACQQYFKWSLKIAAAAERPVETSVLMDGRSRSSRKPTPFPIGRRASSPGGRG